MPDNNQTTPAPVTPPATPETPPAQPELIAGKFKTQEDLIAAYKQLESQLGKPKDEENPLLKTQPAQTQPQSDADLAERNTAIDKAIAEASTTGAVTPETLALLEKQGVPKETVEKHLAALTTERQQRYAAAFDAVGGQAEFDALSAWAEKNMTVTELAEVNRKLATGNLDEVKSTLTQVNRRRIAATGVRGTQFTGVPAGAETYKSREQLHADMRDPRYAKDPAFREAVIKKLSISNI